MGSSFVDAPKFRSNFYLRRYLPAADNVTYPSLRTKQARNLLFWWIIHGWRGHCTQVFDTGVEKTVSQLRHLSQLAILAQKRMCLNYPICLNIPTHQELSAVGWILCFSESILRLLEPWYR